MIEQQREGIPWNDNPKKRKDSSGPGADKGKNFELTNIKQKTDKHVLVRCGAGRVGLTRVHSKKMITREYETVDQLGKRW